MHSPVISATLVRLFYSNVRIILATDLVQQFYTYCQIYDKQAILIISLKKLFNNFLDAIIPKGRNFVLVSSGRIKTDISHTPAQAHKYL
jgi:hypothetical protein